MNNSVEGTPALRSSAKARDFVILQWEFIIVSNFLVNPYRLFAVDYNLLLALDRDYFCVTIRLEEKKTKIELNQAHVSHVSHLSQSLNLINVKFSPTQVIIAQARN